jgi:hypothetical protein
VLVVELLLKPALLSLPTPRLAREALDPVAASSTSQSQQLNNTISTICIHNTLSQSREESPVPPPVDCMQVDMSEEGCLVGFDCSHLRLRAV